MTHRQTKAYRCLYTAISFHHRKRMTYLLNPFTSNIPQLVNARHAANLVHLIQEHNACKSHNMLHLMTSNNNERQVNVTLLYISQPTSTHCFCPLQTENCTFTVRSKINTLKHKSFPRFDFCTIPKPQNLQKFLALLCV